MNKNNEDALKFARVGITILFMPIIYLYFHYLINGIIHESWRGEFGAFFIVLSAGSTFAIIFSFFICWQCFLVVLTCFTKICHFIFGKKKSFDSWLNVLYDRLKIFPIISLFGAFLAFFHIFDEQLMFLPSRFPRDTWISIIANIIGAYFYVPIIFSWFNLRKSQTEEI